MKFNKIIIKNIFETKFWDELTQHVADDIQQMDGNDFSGEFDIITDNLELDSIEDFQVDSYETELDGDETIVTGVLIVLADVNGFAYYDGESFATGTTLLTLIYSYSFTEQEQNFDNLYLEHVD